MRVIRVENEPERFIERELPSAGYEVERSDVFVHPGPVSLLVATAESISDSGTRVGHARRSVSNLIAAVRLATGSTARAVADIGGDPGRIRWQRPQSGRHARRPRRDEVTRRAVFDRLGSLARLAAQSDPRSRCASDRAGPLDDNAQEHTTIRRRRVPDRGTEPASVGRSHPRVLVRQRTRSGTRPSFRPALHVRPGDRYEVRVHRCTGLVVVVLRPIRSMHHEVIVGVASARITGPNLRSTIRRRAVRPARPLIACAQPTAARRTVVMARARFMPGSACSAHRRCPLLDRFTRELEVEAFDNAGHALGIHLELVLST